jgi:predicted SprT family Zn-dependent metalloprotease
MTPANRMDFIPDEYWYGTEMYKATALVIDSCITLELPQYYNRIVVEWSNGLKTTMGNARTKRSKDGDYSGLIRLSVALWPRASEEERKETVIHEAAHILAHIVYGERCDHGPKWVATMARLGYPNASRCHQVDVRGLKRPIRRYAVTCRSCSKEVIFTKDERDKVLNRGYVCHCRCRAQLGAADIRAAILKEIPR